MDNFDLDWEELLSLETLTLEEEKESSLAVSEYLVKHGEEIQVINDAKEYSLLLGEEIIFPEKREYYSSQNFNKMSKNQIIQSIENQNTIEVFPTIVFPQVKELHSLMVVLDKIIDVTNKNGHYSEKQLIQVMANPANEPKHIVNSLIYLGFFKVISNASDRKLINGEKIQEFLDVAIEDRFLFLVECLCQHKAIKESIMLHFFASYDSLTKEVIVKKLKEDLNINEMNLSYQELLKIADTIHGWYIDIRTYLLSYN